MSTGFVREHVDIDAPPQRVWSHVVDWPRQSSWVPATRVWCLDDGVGIGAQIRGWTGVGRVGFLDEMTVTAWDPPWRCEVLHTGRLVRGEGGFVVSAHGADGARCEWWERFRLPGGAPAAWAWPAVRPAVRAGLRRALLALKRDVEG